MSESNFIGIARGDSEKYKQWEPSLAFLIDLLSIVNLKSIKLGCGHPEKKAAYEKEARELMNSIDTQFKLGEIKLDNIDFGRLIRAIQLGQLSNELIWQNETKARLGGEEQNHLLPLTHSLNGMRMRAGNQIVKHTGGRKDLNLDRVNEELIRKYGLDFGGLFDEV